MKQFLDRHGWSLGLAIAGDASARRYFRVTNGDKTAIWMDSSAEPETLAGFIRISKWLNEFGLRAPEIYEADESAGYLLLEDFGDTSFRKAIDGGHDRRELYTLARDVLARLRQAECALALPEYTGSNLHKGHRRVIDWYVPALRQAQNADDLAPAYLAAWEEIEKSLPSAAQSFIHADYHLENLMFIPGGKGLGRCGIIDFQDALTGPAAYDLGNLLEDARITVPADLKTDLLAGQDEGFLLWYRVLATQFHCRVIGQFIKLAVLDGKTQYLPHIPRLATYINDALDHPALKPLGMFLKEEKISFTQAPSLDPAQVRAFIRPDAF